MPNAPRPSQNRRRRDPMNIDNIIIGAGHQCEILGTENPYKAVVFFSAGIVSIGNLTATADGETSIAAVQNGERTVVFSFTHEVVPGSQIVLLEDMAINFGPNVVKSRCNLYAIVP